MIDLSLNSIASVEIDAGNTVSIKNIKVNQFAPASRDADTNAFVQGSRFLFNADVDGNVSTVAITDSTAAMTLGSYIDIDFSKLNLLVGDEVSSYMFMGYSTISGFSNGNVYVTYAGDTYQLGSDGKISNDKFDFELLNEAGQLGYTLIVVPEASTYALIFGALAIVFTVYRRRK